MTLTVEAVEPANLAHFLQYCAQYGPDQDVSYLPGESFTISADQPAYLLLQHGQPAGAISLIRTPSFQEARKGRFAIFHALKPSAETYGLLYQAIQSHFDGLDQVYLFIPRDLSQAAAAFQTLGFEIERQAFVLCLEDPQPRPLDLAVGFEIRPVAPGDQVGLRHFADMVNHAFYHSPGHVYHSPGAIFAWTQDPSYLTDGLCLLYDQDQPVGSICILRDESEPGAAEIIALGVLEEFRGQGLGRRLLRHGINFTIAHGLKPLYLSVNGRNDSAIHLYITEGFSLIDTIVCYTRQLLTRSR